MIDLVDVPRGVSLDDYEANSALSRPVQELRSEAAHLVAALGGRRVWMINSTPRGGGVAEMLPKQVAILRELGVPTEWAVIGSDDPRFFVLTKRLHNLIHGVGDPAALDGDDRALYEQVNRANADSLRGRLSARDILVVHDPQPMAMGALLAADLDLPAVWRCHIGLDGENAATGAAWEFLSAYARGYDHAVFSAPEYIRCFPAHRTAIIHPAIDPLSDKNRYLSSVRLTGVLANAGLVGGDQPVLTPPFDDEVRRLTPAGDWRLAREAEPIGLLFRPVVTQISRWDRLKGFLPLLHAFVRVKERAPAARDTIHRRRLEIVRLVLAGPDPASIPDDPEAQEVLAELRRSYLALPPAVQADIAILSLPMASTRENALIVNALQRASSVVVQNSLEEGFGLTVSEAMWKRCAVLGSSACGIRQQIRDGVDGRLAPDASDSDTVADTLDELLADGQQRSVLGRNAERRVVDNFLVFTQTANWLRLLVRVVEGRS